MKNLTKVSVTLLQEKGEINSQKKLTQFEQMKFRALLHSQLLILRQKQKSLK